MLTSDALLFSYVCAAEDAIWQRKGTRPVSVPMPDVSVIDNTIPNPFFRLEVYAYLETFWKPMAPLWTVLYTGVEV